MGVTVNLKPYYDWAKTVSDYRSSKKEGRYKSSRVLSPNYQIVGFLGELTYAIVVGEPVDAKFRTGGDGGTDFSGGVNIKSSELSKVKHLIETPKKMGEVDVYVMVGIDMGLMYGEILGWIDCEEFQEIGYTRDFGYGEAFAIDIDKLHDPMSHKPIYDAVLKRYNQYGKLLGI